MWQTILKVWGVITPVATVVIKWVDNNKEQIQAIFLKVQKDAKDGLTGAEMEQIAVDLFFEKVYPALPWFAKLLGKGFWEKQVRKYAKKFCKKSHLLK